MGGGSGDGVIAGSATDHFRCASEDKAKKQKVSQKEAKRAKNGFVESVLRPVKYVPRGIVPGCLLGIES